MIWCWLGPVRRFFFWLGTVRLFDLHLTRSTSLTRSIKKLIRSALKKSWLILCPSPKIRILHNSFSSSSNLWTNTKLQLHRFPSMLVSSSILVSIVAALLHPRLHCRRPPSSLVSCLLSSLSLQKQFQWKIWSPHSLWKYQSSIQTTTDAQTIWNITQVIVFSIRWNWAVGRTTPSMFCVQVKTKIQPFLFDYANLNWFFWWIFFVDEVASWVYDFFIRCSIISISVDLDSC